MKVLLYTSKERENTKKTKEGYREREHKENKGGPQREREREEREDVEYPIDKTSLLVKFVIS